MIDTNAYKQVMGSFPSGVTVITTLDDDGQIVGLTASAFSSLSMDPALVLFCPNYSSDSYPVLIKSKRFAIHLLSADQRDEAYAFAKKGKDKAQGIDWTLSELGNPLLSKATAIIECELWREYEGGDHAILVGAVKNLIVPVGARRRVARFTGLAFPTHGEYIGPAPKQSSEQRQLGIRVEARN